MAQARRGRPPKDEADRKSKQFSIRISPGLHERLAEVCQESGQPVAREIEKRLVASFQVDEQREEEFGSKFNYWMLRIIAQGIKTVEHQCCEKKRDKTWREDRFMFNQVRMYIDTILDHFQPKARSRIPKHWRELDVPPWRVKKMGRMFALLEIAALELDALGKVHPGFAWLDPVTAGAALPVGTKRTASALGELDREWEEYLLWKEQK